MTYNEILQLMPDSVYTRKDGSNNQKLWGLYASQLNEIEAVLEALRLVRDVEE